MSLALSLLALAHFSQSPAPAADTLARLVPRDTIVFVQVPSLDQVLAAAMRTRAAFDPSSTTPLDVASLLKDLDIPGAAEQIDPKRPMAVCLVLGHDPESTPEPVFLVPARSPEAFAKSLSTPEHAMTTLVDGGYVLIAPESKTIERDAVAAPIALNLPSGELVARIDLARLVEQFRPMIDASLDQLEGAAEQAASANPTGFDAAPVAGMYIDGLRDLVNSAQTLDIAARLAGEHMELGFDLVNKPGSVLAGFASKEKTDIRALTRFFDPKAAMNLMAGFDWGAMTKRFRPMFDALPEVYPEPMRAGMKQLLGHMDELGAQLGNATSVGADFDASGMHAAYYLRTKDATKLLATYKAMLASVPGLGMDAPTESLIDGVPVTTWHMRLDAKMFAPAQTGAGAGKDPKDEPEDKNEQKEQQAQRDQQAQQMQSAFEKVYGKDGLFLRVAFKGDVVVVVLGGDEAYMRAAIARVGASTPVLPADLQRALEQVGSMSPCFVLRYDIGRMMEGVKTLMSSMMPGTTDEIPSLAFSILAWGGVDGNVWRGALGCDLGEVGSAMRAIAAETAGRAKRAKALADLTLIRTAMDEYATNNAGKIPDVLAVLVAKDTNGHAYLEGEHPLTDPWGREYRYDAPSANKPAMRVYSLGRDGKVGGLGEDADVEAP